MGYIRYGLYIVLLVILGVIIQGTVQFYNHPLPLYSPTEIPEKKSRFKRLIDALLSSIIFNIMAPLFFIITSPYIYYKRHSSNQ